MRGARMSAAVAAVALFLGASVAFGEASAVVEKDRAVLKNEFIEMVFAPGKGGRCTSFKYEGTQLESSPWGSFEERIWEVENYDFPGASYEATVVEAGPQTASIAFRANARTPGYTKLELTRVVTLRAGRSDVEVTATFANHDKQVLPVGYWVFLDFQVPQKENILTMPSKKGLDRAYFTKGKIAWNDPRNSTCVGNERWLYDNPRAFIGWDTDDGTGLAVTLADLERLSMLYNFFTGTDFSSEMAFDELPIEPGKDLVFHWTILPFHGMPSVDGAAGDLALSLMPEPKELPAVGGAVAAKLTAVSGEARDVTLQIRTRLLPNGQWTAAGAPQPLSLKANTAAQAQLNWTPEAEGTYALNVQVMDKGQMIADAEKPFVVGKASAAYAFAGDAKRVGKEMTRYREVTTAHQDDPEVMKQKVAKHHFLRDLDASLVTPHIEWAKPLSGGPLEALFLHGWYNGREVIELAERMDLKYSHVVLLAPEQYKPLSQKGTAPITALEAVMVEKLKGPEKVIVFSSCPCAWKEYQPETRNLLLEQVKNGKGLVYTGDPGPISQDLGKDFVADNAAAKMLTQVMPALYRAGGVRAGTYGKGRIVLLQFGTWTTSNCLIWSQTAGGMTRLNDPGRESACSLTARAMLWASGRDPAATISLAEAATLTSDATKGSKITVKLTGEAAANVDWFIQPQEDVPAMAMPRLPLGEAGQGLTLPHLTAGKYAVYAVARDANGGALDWAASSVTVTTDATVKVELDKPRYEVQDSATARVTADKGARTGTSLQYDLVDVTGRLLFSQTQKLEDAQALHTVEVKLPLALSAAKEVIARATILSKDGPLTSAEATASVRVPRDKDFLYILYGSYLREAADYVGTDYVMWSSEQAARLNLTNYIWGSLNLGDPKLNFDRDLPFPMDQLVRVPCLANPEYIQKCCNLVRDRAKTMALYGDLAFMISDEWDYAGRSAASTNICHCPFCKAVLQQQVREDYKTLDALNAAWGSQFKTWEEVDGPRREEVMASKNFVPWVDLRISQETVVKNFLHALRQTAKEVYPYFRLSISGTHNPGDLDGYDWWKMSHEFEAASLYGGPQVKIVLSWATPNHLYTQWHGYDYPDERGLHVAHELWGQMFEGLGGACDFGSMWWSPMCWPDYSPREYGKASRIGFQALQQGPGPIIANSRMEDDGIGILYSQPCVHVAALEGMRGKPVGAGTYIDTLSSLEAMLADLGFQYRYISNVQLPEGILKTGGYRLLIVPFSEALSPEEIAAIQQFADAGGVVLADICPALTNQHGKPYPVSPLDALFGVKRPAHQTAFRQAEVAVPARPEIGLKESAEKYMLGEEDLTLDGAKAWASFKDAAGAQVPAVIVHPAGKGRAILLNFSLADYEGYRAMGVGGEVSVVNRARAEKTATVQDLVKAILASSGLSPRVLLTSTPVVESDFLARFRSGNAVYLGMTADPKTSHSLHYSLAGLEPSKRYVYDVRSHKYLGKLDSFDYPMNESFGEVVALMPREIGDLSLKVSSKKAKCGDVIQLKLKASGWAAEMGKVVFHVEVTRPDGTLHKLYSRNIVGDDGTAQMTVPFALNDPSGDWHITAFEAVSGHSADVKVRVQSAAM